MQENQPIYLDYNATTPIAEAVADAMAPFLYKHFGNPSSAHHFGFTAKLAVENARKQVAELLNCQSDEIIFTSSGTESNNLALRGYALANRHKGNHIITSSVEHPAVLNVCEYLEKQGFRVTYLPVDSYGWVNPKELRNALTDDTLLVSVMHANNEVGTIEPIRELADIAHKAGAVFHTDAAQSVGKILVDLEALGVDLLSVAGHKLYAPKGVGALFIRQGVPLEKILFGAGQERGLRPGTENVLEIVGLGRAAQLAKNESAETLVHMVTLRDRLYQGLEAGLPTGSIQLNGHPEQHLPNTLNLSFKGVQANVFLEKIRGHVAASAGAACHADQVSISSVLKAMDVPLDWAKGAVRFSVGRQTTVKDIDQAIKKITSSIKELINE